MFWSVFWIKNENQGPAYFEAAKNCVCTVYQRLLPLGQLDGLAGSRRMLSNCPLVTKSPLTSMLGFLVCKCLPTFKKLWTLSGLYLYGWGTPNTQRSNTHRSLETVQRRSDMMFPRETKGYKSNKRLCLEK